MVSQKNINDNCNLKEIESYSQKSQISSERSEVVEIMGDIIVDYEDKEPFYNVDKLPEFIGGNDKFKAYIKKELKIDTLRGKLFCYLEIDKKGNVKNIRIRSAFEKGIENKIKAILNGMPKWKPGEKDGKKVNSIYVVPILFR